MAAWYTSPNSPLPMHDTSVTSFAEICRAFFVTSAVTCEKSWYSEGS